MARSDTINCRDEKGRILSDCLCEAYNSSDHTLTESQYSDATGDADFVALTDAVDEYIKVYHHGKVDIYRSRA